MAAVTGRSEFSAALNQVAHERGLDPFEVLDTIKAAILAAYRRDYDPEGEEEVEVTIDQETGEVQLIKDGKDITPPGFGRIAAQTAKQVLLQRIREAEKSAILTDYSKKVGTIITGMIQRQQGPAYIVDIGRAEGVMPPREQVRTESYYLNQRLKFYITEIRDHDKRSEIIVSRVSPQLVVGLFQTEVPEIAAGSVEIKAVAREPGFRTKIAVASNQLGVDPVGSCVGQRGNRIQTVINELMGEKIDVILYNEDPVKFITAALQPAKNVRIEISDELTEDGQKKAMAVVADDELSLAIGSKGQNVRLAAKLTGYHIDIVNREQEAAGGKPKEVIEGNIFTDQPESSQENEAGNASESASVEPNVETPATETQETVEDAKAVADATVTPAEENAEATPSSEEKPAETTESESTDESAGESAAPTKTESPTEAPEVPSADNTDEKPDTESTGAATIDVAEVSTPAAEAVANAAEPTEAAEATPVAAPTEGVAENEAKTEAPTPSADENSEAVVDTDQSEAAQPADQSMTESKPTESKEATVATESTAPTDHTESNAEETPAQNAE